MNEASPGSVWYSQSSSVKLNSSLRLPLAENLFASVVVGLMIVEDAVIEICGLFDVIYSSCASHQKFITVSQASLF
jgi:hypothetical protein